MGDQYKPSPRDRMRYAKMLAIIRDRLPKDIDDALSETIPAALCGALTQNGFFRSGDAWVSGPPPPGALAVMWNGSQTEIVRVDPKDLALRDFHLLAQKLAALADPDALILDLGAGICALGFALRRVGFQGRILHLDIDPVALQCGLELANAAGLADVERMLANTGALPVSEILAVAGGRKIVVATKGSLHPFVSDEAFENLFGVLLEGLGTVAGAHLELLGYHTPAFTEATRMISPPLKIRDDFRTRDNAFAIIPKFPVEIVERVEMWPQLLSSNTWSYLSWVRSLRRQGS